MTSWGKRTQAQAVHAADGRCALDQRAAIGRGL